MRVCRTIMWSKTLLIKTMCSYSTVDILTHCRFINRFGSEQPGDWCNCVNLLWHWPLFKVVWIILGCINIRAFLATWTSLLSLPRGDRQSATVYLSEQVDMLWQVCRYMEGAWLCAYVWRRERKIYSAVCYYVNVLWCKWWHRKFVCRVKMNKISWWSQKIKSDIHLPSFLLLYLLYYLL